MEPKHQFAAQYVLSRAANERREREALLAAHLAMTTNMQPGLLSGHMSSAAAAHHMAAAAVSQAATAASSQAAGHIGGTASPSAHSDSSTRISTPMNTAAEMKVCLFDVLFSLLVYLIVCLFCLFVCFLFVCFCCWCLFVCLFGLVCLFV